MRTLRWWLICWLASLFFAVIPAQASSPWTVWLYTQATGRLRLIDQSGTLVRDFRLPLPAADPARLPNTVAIAHNGRAAAYVVRTLDDTPTVVVLDLVTQMVITSVTLPPGANVSLEFYGTPHVFSENDTQLAFGYGSSTGSGSWRVVVLDLATGGSFTFGSDSPSAITLGLGDNPFLVPIVRSYRGAEVAFTMLPIPSDALGGPTFIWDTVRSVVQPSVAYSTLSDDTLLMTGETITIVSDTRFGFSSSLETFPMMQFNAVWVYEPSVGAFPFVADTDFSFGMPRFIQNGERVAVTGQRADGLYETRVYERSGGIVGAAGIAINSLQGVFDGFVFTTSDPTLVSPASGSALYFSNTRTGLGALVGVLIWESEPDEAAQIVWTSDNFTVGPSDPPAWAVLAAPINHPDEPLTALGAPPSDVYMPPTLAAAPGALAPGADALINTTEGDRLRLRAGPGLSFAVIAELADDTRVLILEGPQSANGFVWWRIRLADGTSGWVVESADGIRTLVPVYSG